MVTDKNVNRWAWLTVVNSESMIGCLFNFIGKRNDANALAD